MSNSINLFENIENITDNSTNEIDDNRITRNSSNSLLSSNSTLPSSIISSVSIKTKPKNLILTPPTSFTLIEISISRCFSPILRNHFSFIKTTSIKTIINLSGKISSEFESFCDESDIAVNNIFSSSNDSYSILQCLPMLEEFVKNTLELIISLSSTTSVLILGSEENCLDCLLVACLRRIQIWSIVTIISEFRLFIGPHRKLFDMEQFIELFDPNLIDISMHPPEFLNIHYLLLDEEEKLIRRVRERLYTKTNLIVNNDANSLNLNIVNNNNNKSNEEKINDDINKEINSNDNFLEKEESIIDETLFQLFFSNKQMTLSAGIQYDSSISLINDKDEDD